MVTTRWYGMRGEFDPDPFTYDPPTELRGKLAHSFGDMLRALAGNGALAYENHAELLRSFDGQLARALGLPTLPAGSYFQYSFQNFVYSAPQRQCIVAIEVCLDTLRRTIDQPRFRYSLGSDPAEDYVLRFIGSVNGMFRNHQCGYQAELTEGDPPIKLLRADSEFLHVETVRRPLALLRELKFDGAARQFEEAVKECSEENYGDAITDANSAFETTIKIILGREKGKATDLIKALVKDGLLPPYLETGANHLAEVMEMLPRQRDAKSDAHGRLKPEQLETHARLAINLAGSLIVFLVGEYRVRSLDSVS